MAYCLAVVFTCSAAIIPHSVAPPTQGAPSKTYPQQLIKRTMQAVNPHEHPDWAGAFVPDHCTTALGWTRGRLDYFDVRKRLMFWSRQWVVMPPGDQWELPFSTTYSRSIHFKILILVLGKLNPCIETCTLLFRMGKDFGDDVLPLNGGYLKTSDARPQQQGSWHILLASAKNILSYGVMVRGQPCWHRGAFPMDDIKILFLPTKSAMSRKWATSAVGQHYTLSSLLSLGNNSGNSTGGVSSE